MSGGKWYWVAYTIVDTQTGGSVGAGACDVRMPAPPRDAEAVRRLSQELTEANHQRGEMPRWNRAVVLSWSEMEC